MSRRGASTRSVSPNKKAFNALKGRPVNKSHFSSGVVDKAQRVELEAQNRLVVKLFEGSQLLASDAETGKSDPICFMWAGPAEAGMPDWDDPEDSSILRSAVCPTTVDPMWRSEHSFSLQHVAPTDRLLIFVRDEDIEQDGSSSYDSLGLIEMSFKDIICSGKKVNNTAVVLGPVWKDLRKYPGMRRVDGKIKLTLTLHFGNSEESKKIVQEGLLQGSHDSGQSLADMIDAVQHKIDPVAHPVRNSSPARPLSASRSSSRRPSSASPSRSRSGSKVDVPVQEEAQTEPHIEEPVLPTVAEEQEVVPMSPPGGGDEAFPSFSDMKNTVTSFFGATPQQQEKVENDATDQEHAMSHPATVSSTETAPIPAAPADASTIGVSVLPDPNGETHPPSETGNSADPSQATGAEVLPTSTEATENIEDPPTSLNQKASEQRTQNVNAANTPIAAAAPVQPAPTTDVKPPSQATDAVKLPTKSAAPLPVPVATIPPTTSTQYKLRITDIAVKNLKNTGNMIDKQDPAVRLTLGGTKKETARMQDAGIAARFSDVLEFDVPGGQSVLDLNVDVVNKNKNNEDKKLIGTGSASVQMQAGATPVKYAVDLAIGDDKQGTVTFKCSFTGPSGPAPTVGSIATAQLPQSKNTSSTQQLNQGGPHPVSSEELQVGTGLSGNVAKTQKQLSSAEDERVAKLQSLLEKANMETQSAQHELEKLTKEVEIRALQAQLKQKEDQKLSVSKQMEGLKRALTQMDEGSENVDESTHEEVTNDAVPIVKDSKAASKAATDAKDSKLSKAKASQKRAEDAKARVKEFKRIAAEKAPEPDISIVVKPKGSKRNNFVDRDTDEEDDDDDRDTVRLNTMKNRKIPVDKKKRAVSYPEGDDELLVMESDNFPDQGTYFESGEIDSSSEVDALRYPYRGNKKSLSRNKPNDPAVPLPPDTYPLRPSSSVLKELSHLKKSTEDTMSTLLLKLSAIEKSLGSHDMNPDEPETSDRDRSRDSKTSFPQKSVLSSTAPAAMQSPQTVRPHDYRYHSMPEPPTEPRSDIINWKHVSSCLQKGQLHTAVSSVLACGYSDDILVLMKSIGAIPQRLSVAHRNSLFETISRVLSSGSTDTQFFPCVDQSGDAVLSHRKESIDVCLSWVFALVNEGLTSTLTRSCHARLLDALNKVSQEQANNTGVMACQYEHELRRAY